MKRIGFVGVPGSGKSSVARGLAARGYEKLKKVELVSEYARRFISKYGTIDQVVRNKRCFHIVCWPTAMWRYT